jgi:hypothetical protein
MNAPSYAYRTGDRCGQCGRSHFYVGRITAECAFCSASLPLADSRISTHPLTEELRKFDFAADIDLSLALRKAKRPRNSARASKGWTTRRAAA